jgi:hypothetical protein
MGYRSDLIVLIYPDTDTETADNAAPAYEQLKVLMATTFKDVVADKHFESCMAWIDESHVLKFKFDSVKWYPSYADVQMFEKMLAVFNGDDEAGIEGYCTEFIRIGEESGDIEQRSSGDNCEYHLQVCSEIDCNV